MKDQWGEGNQIFFVDKKLCLLSGDLSTSFAQLMVPWWCSEVKFCVESAFLDVEVQFCDKKRSICLSLPVKTTIAQLKQRLDVPPDSFLTADLKTVADEFSLLQKYITRQNPGLTIILPGELCVSVVNPDKMFGPYHFPRGSRVQDIKAKLTGSYPEEFQELFDGETELTDAQLLGECFNGVGK